MKRPRSALRLPRYTLRKPVRGGWAYFFNPPMWARRDGCPVKNEPLGSDYDKAVARAETVLLPAFDSWRGGGEQQEITVGAKPGTLDWVFAEYRDSRDFTKLNPRTKRNHESGFRLVGDHILKDRRRLGSIPVSLIDTGVTVRLYEKLLVVEETKADGSTIKRERLTTANHAMKSCRKAWNAAHLRNPRKLPANPFANMKLESSDKETPTATFDELQAFRAKAIEMGLQSLATAALIAWEWTPRVNDIFATFEVGHYRPKERPDAVRVVHEKTGQEAWFPLHDDDGKPFYPELMAELDAIKKVRIAGLMLRRDWGKQGPWATFPREGEVGLSQMSRKVKDVIRAGGLRDELTFTSFRHGGFTDAADSDCTDAEIRALGRHKSAKVLPRYAKRTMKQVAAVARKRRAGRTKQHNLSE